jgi:hypothetical protein
MRLRDAQRVRSVTELQNSVLDRNKRKSWASNSNQSVAAVNENDLEEQQPAPPQRQHDDDVVADLPPEFGVRPKMLHEQSSWMRSSIGQHIHHSDDFGVDLPPFGESSSRVRTGSLAVPVDATRANQSHIDRINTRMSKTTNR